MDLKFRGQHTTSRYKDSLQIAYCCVTNHSQLNRLKQLQLFILFLTVIWADWPRGDNALFHVMSWKQLNRVKRIHFEDNSIPRPGRCMPAVPVLLSGPEGEASPLFPWASPRCICSGTLFSAVWKLVSKSECSKTQGIDPASFLSF